MQLNKVLFKTQICYLQSFSRYSENKVPQLHGPLLVSRENKPTNPNHTSTFPRKELFFFFLNRLEIVQSV